MAGSDPLVNLTIRAAASCFTRADALIEPLAEHSPADDHLGLWNSVRWSRSMVLRVALARGLQALEQEVNGEPTPEPAPAVREVTRQPDPPPVSAAAQRPSGFQEKPAATVAGAKLRAWRHSEGLGVSAAADRLGVSRATLSRYELKSVSPNARAAVAALVPGIDADDWTAPVDGEG